MPGHSRVSDSIFLNKEGQHKKYICPSCHYLLRDAVQPSCGHWLCQTCAEDLFKSYSEENMYVSFVSNLIIDLACITVIFFPFSISLPKCLKEDCKEELTREDGANVS